MRITELHQILDMSVCPQEGSVLEARPVAGGLILEMRKRDQRNPETAPNLRHLRVSTTWLQLLPPSTAVLRTSPLCGADVDAPCGSQGIPLPPKALLGFPSCFPLMDLVVDPPQGEGFFQRKFWVLFKCYYGRGYENVPSLPNTLKHPRDSSCLSVPHQASQTSPQNLHA